MTVTVHGHPSAALVALPPLDDRFSARRGTYRIIYRVDGKTRVVTVVDIAHRRDAYRT